MSRALAVAALSASLACAAVDVSEPKAPVGTPASEDERGVFRLAEEAEKRYLASGKVLDAPELEGYLEEIARTLTPPDALASLRLRVHLLRDRSINAGAMPTGALFINTGLLARLDDEAEVAAVLGHELSHVLHRHLLLAQRRRAEVFAISLLSQLSEYSQEHEREADRDAVAALARAGYRVNAAATALEKMAAWDQAEKVKDPKYPSHPPHKERIAAAWAQVKVLAPGGVTGSEAYAAKIADLLLVNARLELASARYEWARAQVERHLALRPASAAGHALLGEVARREAAQGHEQAALASYRKAVELDPKLAEGWRGLGLVLQKTGDHAAARRALTTYLELAPDAPDRGHVRSYLDAPEGKPTP